jgi:hypothetical protein
LTESPEWYAAYALGLAFSSESSRSAVKQLLDVAGDERVDVLETARGVVAGIRVGDEATRRRAGALLDEAAARLRRA